MNFFGRENLSKSPLNIDNIGPNLLNNYPKIDTNKGYATDRQRTQELI
jgi:hypothetical protein